MGGHGAPARRGRDPFRGGRRAGAGTLFDAAALGGDDRADATQGAALIRDEKKRRSLLAATDALQERFGDGTVRFGFELRQSGNTTGSSSKNVEDYK